MRALGIQAGQITASSNEMALNAIVTVGNVPKKALVTDWELLKLALIQADETSFSCAIGAGSLPSTQMALRDLLQDLAESAMSLPLLSEANTGKAATSIKDLEVLKHVAVAVNGVSDSKSPSIWSLF